MAPRVVGHPGARPTELEVTVDSVKSSSVFRPSEDEEDTHPHACTEGFVFLTYTILDEEVGEKAERIEAILCRRCAEVAETGEG
jgi:hypothetical protein